MSVLKEAGLNFHRLDCAEDVKSSKFKEVNLKSQSDFKINSGAFYEIIIYNDLKKFEVKSCLLHEIENEQEFSTRIKQVICSEHNCYFLHDGGISTYNVMTKVFSPINVILKIGNERIVQICSTSKALYGMSSNNCLYQILPENCLVHEFETFQKIKKIQSGFEHIIILTFNGDIFSLGCSLRGQTGLGTLNPAEEVTLIDALSGIKIVDIACASFFTLAVSSFGDVYSFGWNTNGQLGLKKSSDRCKQVYTLPELVELDELDNESVTQVFCGSKHTILRTGKNKLFVSGLNNFGQLGLDSGNEIDTFKELAIGEIKDKTILCCGYWKSYLINYRE